MMESRGSIGNHRVTFVPVPNARYLVRATCSNEQGSVSFEGGTAPTRESLDGAIVWLDPWDVSDLGVASAVALLKANGVSAVRVLPRETEDAQLPAAAGSPAPNSDVSEVRPVVAELVAELPEALREGVSAACERYLSEAGL